MALNHTSPGLNNENSANLHSINKALLARKKQKHRKSKLGCLNCRQRRIKCGEELDSCYNCLDRYLRCSFLDLSDSEKQNIVRQHKLANDAPKVPLYDNNDKELQNLANGNFYFSVEKLSIGGPSLSRPKNKSAGAMFSKLDFTLSPSSDSAPSAVPPSQDRFSNSIQGLSPHNANDSTPTHELPSNSTTRVTTTSNSLSTKKECSSPLSNYIEAPISFKLLKIKRTKFSDFDTHELCTICGEDDPWMTQFKNKMAFWFFDMSCDAIDSALAFHTIISRACFTLLNQYERSSAIIKPSSLILALIRRFANFAKLNGLRLAQDIIEKLNSREKLSDVAYFRLIKAIFNYSSITFSLTLFSGEDFKTVITFIDGYISIATMREFVVGINEMAKKYMGGSSELYDQIALTKGAIDGSSTYHTQHIKTIIIPTYTIEVFHEFQNELSDFISIIKSRNSDPNVNDGNQYEGAKIDCKYSTVLQAEELARFMDNNILSNPNILEKYNPELVCPFEPSEIFHILSSYLTQYPSENMFLQEKAYSMTATELLTYIFWYASGALLDSFLPETYFLYSTAISGIVSFNGFSDVLVNQLFAKLEKEFKHVDYALYEFLFRKAVYLMRAISFLKFRFTVYLRNLKVKSVFPNISTDEHLKLRLESRKVKHLKEQMIYSFKHQAIQPVNYPHEVVYPPLISTSLSAVIPTDLDDSGSSPFFDSLDNSLEKADDSLEHLRPMSRENLKFYNDGFDTDANVDSNRYWVKMQFMNSGSDIDKLPIECIKLSKYGLIKNVDFRPNLFNNGDIGFGKVDFSTLEDKLKKYSSDRNAILMLEIPRDSNNPPR